MLLPDADTAGRYRYSFEMLLRMQMRRAEFPKLLRAKVPGARITLPAFRSSLEFLRVRD